MTFWTVLLITYLGGADDGSKAGAIIYPSIETCLAATTGVSDTLPYDHQLRCIESDMASSSGLRPKRNPIYAN